MPKIIPLTSQIFSTGTKFVVTDDTKDSTFGPGTTGFISYIKGYDQDYSNVVYLNTVIVKRGKGGKKRIDNSDLTTPIFDLNDENFLKIMPEEKRRYYVHIELAPSHERAVQNMPEIDFLGWANAQARYIQKLSTRAKHVSVWPSSSDHFLNRILNIDGNYGDGIGDDLTNNIFREKFTKGIRMMEATLVKCSLLYMYKISELERKAITDLCAEGLNIGDPSVMNETLDSFTKKQNALHTLILGHGKKSLTAAVKEASNDLSWL